MQNLSSNTIPHTSSKAQVSKLERVQDVFAIEVKNAMYRGATFSGVIELVNGSDSIRKFKGAYRANAKLAWFGQQLKKRNPFVNLAGAEVTLLPCYTGDVVACLG
ncbi:MAG: hypothetical protein RLZZ601_2104 [Pseudomonadota bacterium]|jgi:hypothetical protein